MESELISNFEDHQSSRKKSIISFWILTILNIILLCLLVGIVIYAKKSLNASKSPISSPLDHLAEQFMDSLPDSFLPDSFAVEDIYRNPATDQGARGTCWAWSTIYLLETQYRAQGVKQGYLRPNEYVKFSVQAYSAYLGNYCKSNPKAKVCQYGGFLNTNSTNDNQVEAFPYFLDEVPNLDKLIMPEAVCPYLSKKDPVTDFQCEHFEEASKSNPIQFNYKGMKTAYDIRAIKQLIYSVQRPIGIGTPLGTINYMIPCNGSAYSNTPACLEKWFPCPDSQTEEYCYNLQIQGRTKDGTFVSIDQVERSTEFGGHAMNIMGYNDNWRYNNRLASPKSLQGSRGCFILHNSWRADGHSISYLMGERTIENEQTSCPNHRASESWIPATLQCIKDNKNNITNCSQDIKRIRGHGLTNGPDLLKCIDSTGFHCQPSDNYKYVLGSISSSVNAVELPNGLYKVEIIRWKDDVEPESIFIDTVPFWALTSYFTPVTVLENNPNECGFYALPYSTVENMIRRSWDLFDNFKASDIEVEFLPSSYIRSKESKNYNTKYLSDSTLLVNETKFDGPIPFDLVY